MRRLLLRFDNLKADAFEQQFEVALSEEKSRHLVNVLRLSAGDEIEVLNPESGLRFAALLQLPKKGPPAVVILRPLTFEREIVAPSVTLFCAVLKGSHTEEMAQKACELGASHLAIFQAERSVVQLKGDNKRLERLVRIVEGACEQCSRVQPPVVTFSSTLREALDQYLQNDPRLAEVRYACLLTKEAVAIQTLAPKSKFYALAIGPEGDFSAEEETLLGEYKFAGISLGKTILRAETAAIAALAMLKARLPAEEV